MSNTAIGAKKNELIFKNGSHRKFYEKWLPKCRHQDVYHKALIYCLGLNEDTRNHITEIYNFESGYVQTECLQEGWITSGAVKVIRMAFNLYCNGTPSVLTFIQPKLIMICMVLAKGNFWSTWPKVDS